MKWDRKAYRILSVLGTVKSARRGPGALGRRVARQRVNRVGNRWLRRILKP